MSSFRTMVTVVPCILAVFVVEQVPADEKLTPPKPASHTTQTIEGWTVQVDDRLLGDAGGELGERTLRILSNRLYDVKMVVPADKLMRLQQVTIWLDRTHGELTSAQYHPSAVWLRDHGYAESLARCVHIPSAERYASVEHQRIQPWSILHELAHAYHDQVLGFDNATVETAYQSFCNRNRYDQTLYINGGNRKHYALTNAREFFAEMTEALFGTNDFFPFNRAELQREEPEIYGTLTNIWGVKR